MLLALTLLVGVAFVSAGCGSSSTPTSTTTSTSTSISTPTSTAAATTSTTAATSTTQSTTTTTAANPGLGLLTSGNCNALLGLSSSFASALTGASKDPTKTAALLKQFADQTPAAIRPDFQAIAAAYSKLVAALGGATLTAGQTPNPAVLAKLSTLFTPADAAKLSAASQRVAAWATANCHG
jgi:uncharacterized membrane protein